ncbi:MAG: tungsten ABC transporter substrate-binding protein, partial [Desulfuromonadales bacterium]|nr:tungsten ABC transporter substrate-binding protein [Desulfuromonadales bacterium]NIS43806.1 tungsten ABC transporter substrate-binding protein [Desulfuromonadales bacterium]
MYLNRFALLLTFLLLVQPALAAERLRLATTTSTENSGLLAELLPPFEQANDCQVDVIAVGTGKAIKLGEAGDVDVILVHARSREDG